MAHISHRDSRIVLPKRLLGRTRALTLGYSPEQLDRYASISQQGFSGAGNPFLIRTIKKGEVVADIGCGTGTDACIAAGLVGSSGQVFGIESDSNSLTTARQQASHSRLRNITFTKAYAEKLPLPNECADVVISNGTLSQCANKVKVITEIFRILKPGGFFVSSTVCLANSPWRFIKPLVPLGKLLGLMPDLFILEEAELANNIEDAGFEIETRWRHGKDNINVFIIARKLNQ